MRSRPWSKSRVTPSPPPLPEPLTSTRSATVARLRRLHDRKGRTSAGAFLAEGPDCVRAAVEAGWATSVLASVDHELTDWLVSQGIRVVPAAPRVVDAACDTASSQGIVAECSIPRSDLGGLLAATGPVVVCERISDPGNLGTIIRTAEAVGAAGVITTEGSVDPWNPKAVRASAGSSFRVPIAPDRPVEAILAASAEAGRWSIALAGDAPEDVVPQIQHARAGGYGPKELTWVVGSEARGISTQMRAGVSATARLPMAPTVESLNAAVSVAICLYAADWI
jgi:TrmH family RNA methyltransferase